MMRSAAAGTARQPHAAGELALVHGRAGRKPRIGRTVRHRHAKAVGIDQDPPHHLGIDDRPSASVM